MTPLDVAIAATLVATAGLLAAILVPAPSGRACGFGGLLLSGVLSLDASFFALLGGTPQSWGNADIHFVLRLDPLSAIFVGILGAVAIAAGLYALGGRSRDERRTGRTAAAAASAIVLASLLVCLADDVYLFLFAWELLALAFYWAVTFAGTDDDAPRAGYFTLTLTHVAGAALFIAILILAPRGASVAAALAGASALPPAALSAIFVLLVVGFGGKIGLLPLQGWLPYAYRTAPSVVAALMAGGALNVGFYGIARFILNMPGPLPLWWGLLLCSIGAVGALLGVAWAAAQRDARNLAAYSSIENSGIIVAGLGIALVGKSLDLHLLVGVGLASAFLHIAGHALAKCTLFLSCATMQSCAGTTSFDELGGLSRRLPWIATGAGVAAFSLAAIPPTAGFTSEWLTLEAFMQAFRSANAAVEVTFAVSAAAIGIAAGIAVVAFVKFFGIGFLGTARSEGASSPHHPGFLWSAATVLCGASVLVLGLFAPQFLRLIAPAVDGQSGAATITAMLAARPVIQPAFGGFSSVSPLGLGALIAGFALVFAAIARAFRRPPARRSEPWTSGEPYRSWTQYGGTGFANPTRVILDVGIRTRRTVEDVEGAGVRYESGTRPFFDVGFFRPLIDALMRISDAVRATQSGAIATYLSYILIFTILLLVLYPAIRHW